MELEVHGNVGALLGHLSEEQRRRLDMLDVTYAELLSRASVPTKADFEALDEAVVAFYDGLAKAGVRHENGA